MQTFLPYPDFEASAFVLSDDHLKWQRLEVHKILQILHGQPSGWARHSVCEMWKNDELSLTLYGLTLCNEWTNRGHRDKGFEPISRAFGQDIDWQPTEFEMPWWLGIPELHLSHQSHLLRSDPSHYSRWFRHIPDDLLYWWPDEVQVED